MKASPDNVKVSILPAQVGNWSEGKVVEVTITVRWSDGTERTENVKLHKPDKCGDDD